MMKYFNINNELFRNADTLFIRKDNISTYGKLLADRSKNPTGNKPTDNFAVLIDNISKIVYSRSLKNVDWKNTKLKRKSLKKKFRIQATSGQKHFSWKPKFNSGLNANLT